MTTRPLDAARDALIALQGQLIAVLAAQNAALATRVGELEAANAELRALAHPRRARGLRGRPVLPVHRRQIGSQQTRRAARSGPPSSDPTTALTYPAPTRKERRRLRPEVTNQMELPSCPR